MSNATLKNFTVSAAGRLTYTGTPAAEGEVIGVLSVTAAANNTILAIRIAKNGTTLAASEQQVKLAIGADAARAAHQHDAMAHLFEHLAAFLYLQRHAVYPADPVVKDCHRHGALLFRVN